MSVGVSVGGSAGVQECLGMWRLGAVWNETNVSK